MKKLLILFLGIMTVASAFAGGSSSQSSGGGTQAAGTGTKGLLANGDKTISVLIRGQGTAVTSYNYAQNAFTKKMTDETGVNFTFETVPIVDEMAKMALLFASSTYPDVIMGVNTDQGTLDYYGQQGYIIPLNDLLGNMSKYPNIKALFDEYPGIWQKFSGSDGKLYGIPNVNECFHCINAKTGLDYYMPWLRDNNLKTPTTIDEFTDVLRYYKTHDMNGNGDTTDEIPFLGGDGNGAFLGTLAGAFLPYNNHQGGLAVRDGQLWIQYLDPAFRELLKYANLLYREGLVNRDVFTITGEQINALKSGQTPLIGFASGNVGDNLGAVAGIEGFHLLPLKGPSGAQYNMSRDPWSAPTNPTLITDKCKDPALVLAWIDYMLGFEVTLDGFYGPKGVYWEPAPAGSKGADGSPALYQLTSASIDPVTTAWTVPVNQTWDQNASHNSNRKFYMGRITTGYDTALKFLQTGDPTLVAANLANPTFTDIKNYYWASQVVPYKIPDNMYVPPVIMQPVDSDRNSDISAQLDPYKDQTITKFITGELDVNSDAAWNAYVDECNRLGATERIQIYGKYLKR
jgi:putative aldouronate transport system substrate-binding protein